MGHFPPYKYFNSKLLNLDSIMALFLSIHIWKCEEISNLFFCCFSVSCMPKMTATSLVILMCSGCSELLWLWLILCGIILIQLSLYHTHFWIGTNTGICRYKSWKQSFLLEYCSRASKEGLHLKCFVNLHSMYFAADALCFWPLHCNG